MYLFDVPPDPVSLIGSGLSRLWYFLPVGYLATVLIELPLLVFLLPKELGVRARIACGFWLTACTYPIVVLVLPALMASYSRGAFLLVAETFAPVAECFLFWLAFRNSGKLNRTGWIRSFLVIVIANLASFGVGEILNAWVWSRWF
jgi:hypothetical protein